MQRSPRFPVLAAATAAVLLGALAPDSPAQDARIDDLQVRSPGVNPRRVKVGIHGPLTGPAPIPSSDAQAGASLYFRWRRVRDRPIAGRAVRVVLRNDNGSSAQGEDVCRELIHDEHVFLVMAYGTTYPNERCARVADAAGVPYLSTGYIKSGFRLPRYFATGMTWERQSRLLADFLIETKGAETKETAVVYVDMSPEKRARRSFVRAMSASGVSVTYQRRLRKNATASDAETVVAEMKRRGIDIVYVLTRPLFFLQLLQAAQNQAFGPLWTGINTLMTTDGVADIGCRKGTLRRARFFSPTPAVAGNKRFDPAYRRALKRFRQGPPNATTWQGWAAGKALARMLDRVGRKLTRSRFARVVQSSRFRTGILSPLSYSPRDHFGADSVHVLRADCATNSGEESKWRTARSFVEDF